VGANSPYLRRRLIPSWARPTLFIRNERVLTAAEADSVREGDYVYLLAPPEKAEALDRFFVDMPPPAKPDPRLLGDFFVSGEVTLGALAEIYGLQIAPEDAAMTLAEDFRAHLKRPAKTGDILPIGTIALVAHKVVDRRVVTVGLRLADPEPQRPVTPRERARAFWQRVRKLITG
jgi:cell volume regulation protein A